MINPVEVGKKLSALRGDKTQEKVAGDCGISISALAMYESGRRTPRDEIKVKLARYYNTTVEELFLQTKYTKCEQILS